MRGKRSIGDASFANSKNRINKKGQFFLLAAVIISAIIISFGAGTNKAVVNEESEEFYNSVEEVRREIAAFLDYAVYEDSVDVAELETFLDLLANNTEEASFNIDFAFIYRGNGNKLGVKNYGSRDIYVKGELVERRGETKSTIKLDEVWVTTIKKDPVVRHDITLEGDKTFLVKIDADSDGVSFPFLDNQWVIVVAQKEERGDVYVSIG